MTALAMILGTVPMALALEEGSEMTAPLGRAVIGGLVVSTFATLLVVPAIFTLLMGNKTKVSPSMDPDDSRSRHFDGDGHEVQAAHGGPRPEEPRTLYSRRLLLMGRLLLALILLSTLTSGCGRTAAEATTSVSSVPEVHVVKPQRRNLTCTVEQPGFVRAYEETAIYSKVSGFIKHYYVDIGQQVKKGDLLVEIFVPELVESHQQTVAQVELDRKMVEQSQQLVLVAQSKHQTAIAQLAEAKANVGKYQADIVRWESEVQRLTKMVEQRVVDREVLDETQKQLSSSRAARDAALAAVSAREAAEVSAQADVGKARIDVETAKAQVAVAEAEERRTAAMLAYTKVTAPYDGIVTIRNANTGDYVQAATGDKSTSALPPCSWLPATTWCESSWTFLRPTPATSTREPRPT